MKIYAFYKKPTKDILDLPPGEMTLEMKYPLYAFTTDKSIAAIFLASRKRSIFLAKQYKVTEEEYEEWAIPKRGNLLNWVMFENLKTKEPTLVNMVATDNEANFVLEIIESHGVWNYIDGWVPIQLFHGKLRKSLEELQYNKIYNFAVASRYGTYNNPDTGIYEDGGFDIMDLDLKYSQFGVFLLIYGYTLSKDFMKYADVIVASEKDSFGIYAIEQ